MKIPYRIQVRLRKYQSILKEEERKKVSEYADMIGLPAPIFIVGLPRSGSTLVYQLIVNALRLCYFSNLADVTHRIPVTTSKALGPIGIARPPGNYRSKYGITVNWNDPSIALNIWGRWFSRDQTFSSTVGLSEETLKQLKGTINGMQAIFELPFVGKWQGFNSNLRSLKYAFPSSMFIRVIRNHKQVARSIIRARKEQGSIEEWFSSRSSAYEAIVNSTKDPVEQVCQQILQIEKDLDKFEEDIDNKKVLYIDYHDLCCDPQGFIDAVVHRYYALTKCSLNNRSGIRVPEEFQESNNNNNRMSADYEYTIDRQLVIH